MNDSSRTYISVILPLKLDWTPCYGTGTFQVSAGNRVRVLFSGKEYIGAVSETGIAPATDPSKIRDIEAVETELEQITEEELRLWKSVSGYYMCSIGEVYRAAYPARKISQEEAQARMAARKEAVLEKQLETLRQRKQRTEERLSKKRQKIAETLARQEAGRKVNADTLTRLHEEEGRILAELDSLCARSAALTANGNVSRSLPGSTEALANAASIELSDSQRDAFGGIKEAFRERRPVLLHGVTGSGKTEIYIKLAAEMISQGRNVLYLVPEIALSRQLEDRIRNVFGEMLYIFHSSETLASRRDTATKIRNSAKAGSNYVVLGTRSSLFLPHNRLGLIIVDEEHDTSYKQDTPAPRYNGRDTAIMLAGIHGCDIILGSATPSMESMYNCHSGKFRLVRLDKRYYDTEDADIEIIDTKAERRKNGMEGSFSIKLILKIRQALQRNGQVIILRARRSYSPVLQCPHCGHIPKCPHCNVSLSRHKNPDRLMCHHCEYTAPFSSRCPVCGSELQGLGSGTQKIEEEARALFPFARIARLDSDTSQSSHYETETIRKFNEGEMDILIGTQIVTKGFDFPGLSLVAAIAADSLLGVQDFRADERAVQTLEQFRGRCGRRGRKGIFIIQTSQPEHPVYQRLADGKDESAYLALLKERREFGYPPFTRIVNVIIKDNVEERAERMSWSLAADIRRIFAGYFPDGEMPVLNQMMAGPYAPVIDRIGDKYIRIIRLNLKKDRKLVQNKKDICQTINDFQEKHRYQGHVTVDADPN